MKNFSIFFGLFLLIVFTLKVDAQQIESASIMHILKSDKTDTVNFSLLNTGKTKIILTRISFLMNGDSIMPYMYNSHMFDYNSGKIWPVSISKRIDININNDTFARKSGTTFGLYTSYQIPNLNDLIGKSISCEVRVFYENLYQNLGPDTPDSTQADSTAWISMPKVYWQSDSSFTGTGITPIDFGGKEINIFPNPFGDQINISTPENTTQVAVFNSLGQEIAHFDQKEGTNVKEISTASWNKGIFFVKISDSNGDVVTREIIKE